MALVVQLIYLPDIPLLTAAICLGGIVLAFASRWALSPLKKEIQALNHHAQNLQDGSFNTSANQLRVRELGPLANTLNSMSVKLQKERGTLYQRELLLDTVLQSSPTAFILTDANENVLMVNPAACQLINTGKSFVGSKLSAVVANQAELAKALSKQRQGLVRLHDETVWHISANHFQLNHKLHWLYLIKPLTREIRREELTAWKKLLRIIGHELNNTLAPLSSLAFSGQQRAQELNQSELAQFFDTINERSRELNDFVQAYISFAKLPPPILEVMNWPRLINQLQDLYEFELEGELPALEWRADRKQFQQMLVNLLKNAHESGSPPEQIFLLFSESKQQLTISLRDAGGGMNDEALENALIPFYTSKNMGSGIGLTLSRDIIEAHNGAISLHNRPPGLEIIITLPKA
ncbi:ATP-binding protein [Aliidiomarina shirensis]|uniref:histidine kinase n=1 Tax=Aliidiomarina shirensis TaxID=1048642 RepID=A0A432WQL0_9GAMM|nr:ATP-binding protein [Aliidiomarina shirensis]